MQHPDEGTIHSWLDGAVSAEEAARMESHVSECSTCQAAVAEARGFIAASSRILTALDDVPRGVLPAVPAKRRDLRVFWRAAAAMLVVAGGTLVVLRDGGSDAGDFRDESLTLSTPTAGSTDSTSSVPSPVADANQAKRADSRAPTAEIAVTQAPAAPPATRRLKDAPLAKESSSQVELRRATESGGKAGSISADAVTLSPSAAGIQANTATADGDVRPLKVVRVERSIGSRRTIYEVGPSETVTLSEPESMQLSQIVVTGAAAGAVSASPQRQSTGRGARTAQPMSVESAKAPPPPAPADPTTGADSARAEIAATRTSALTRAQPSAALNAATNTITWIDPRTGQTLTLSGNLPVERLQEIRKRIENERAATNKKLP